MQVVPKKTLKDAKQMIMLQLWSLTCKALGVIDLSTMIIAFEIFFSCIDLLNWNTSPRPISEDLGKKTVS